MSRQNRPKLSQVSSSSGLFPRFVPHKCLTKFRSRTVLLLLLSFASFLPEQLGTSQQPFSTDSRTMDGMLHIPFFFRYCLVRMLPFVLRSSTSPLPCLGLPRRPGSGQLVSIMRSPPISATRISRTQQLLTGPLCFLPACCKGSGSLAVGPPRLCDARALPVSPRPFRSARLHVLVGDGDDSFFLHCWTFPFHNVFWKPSLFPIAGTDSEVPF